MKCQLYENMQTTPKLRPSNDLMREKVKVENVSKLRTSLIRFIVVMDRLTVFFLLAVEVVGLGNRMSAAMGVILANISTNAELKLTLYVCITAWSLTLSTGAFIIRMSKVISLILT